MTATQPSADAATIENLLHEHRTFAPPPSPPSPTRASWQPSASSQGPARTSDPWGE